MRIGCRVTAIASGQFIAFQWRSPKQFKSLANAADPLTHVVVMFSANQGGTRVHVVHSGWPSSPEWEEARLWQEKAGSESYKRRPARSLKGTGTCYFRSIGLTTHAAGGAVRDLHFVFLDRVAQKFVRLSTKSQKKHQPSLLTYLQRELGRAISAPSY
jgi:hypothetical protein